MEYGFCLKLSLNKFLPFPGGTKENPITLRRMLETEMLVTLTLQFFIAELVPESKEEENGSSNNEYKSYFS